MECIFCLNENAYFDGVNYVCPDCGREWPCDEIADDDDDNNKLRCPECGSHLVYPDSSGINDYACDACGCRWDGDDDDYEEDYAENSGKMFFFHGNISCLFSISSNIETSKFGETERMRGESLT